MLENTPWPSRTVNLPMRKRKKGCGKPDHGAEREAAAPSESPSTPVAAGDRCEDRQCSEKCFPVELRWGLPLRDLPAVWRLHELSLPLSYDMWYYDELLSERSLCLVAYTTPEAFAGLHSKDKKGNGLQEGGGEGQSALEDTSDTDSNASFQEVSSTVAAAEARLRTDGYSERFVDQLATEVATELAATLALEEQHSCKDVGVDGDGGVALPSSRELTESGSAFTEVVGFAASGITFARDRQHTLFVNPTVYLVTLAVLPRARCLGIGRELLQSLLLFVTEFLPLRASHYLHYSEERMRSMVWRTLQKAPSAPGTSSDEAGQRKADAAAPRPTHTSSAGSSEGRPPVKATGSGRAKDEEGTYSLWETAAHLFFPEAFLWLERRRLRKALIAGGLSEKEASEEVERRYLGGQEQREEEEEGPHAAGPSAEDEFFKALSSSERQGLLNPVIQFGVREVWLHCIADDRPLKRFYQSIGFTVAREVLPGYYHYGGEAHDASLLLYRKKETDCKRKVTRDANAVSLCGETDLATLATMRGAVKEEKQPPPPPPPPPLDKEGGTTRTRSLVTLRRRVVRGAEERKEEERTGGGTCASSEEPANPPGLPPSSKQSHVKWLSPATYGEVEDVDFSSVSKAREKWEAAWKPQRAKERDVTSWGEQAKEIALTLNALLCLLAVCYFAYNYGVRR